MKKTYKHGFIVEAWLQELTATVDSSFISDSEIFDADMYLDDLHDVAVGLVKNYNLENKKKNNNAGK